MVMAPSEENNLPSIVQFATKSFTARCEIKFLYMLLAPTDIAPSAIQKTLADVLPFILKLI